jgi:hypothetical protein
VPHHHGFADVQCAKTQVGCERKLAEKREPPRVLVPLRPGGSTA